MANRYLVLSELEGFINVYEPAGKYNNCCFSFRLPPDILNKAEQDREELLAWVKTKVENPNRVALNPPKWDDEGLVKFSYGGDTSRPAPIFVDTNGDPIPKETLRSVSRGTKVRLIVDQTPYTKPAMGTTLKIKGVQILELHTGQGAVDSGEMSVEDVVALFGESEGFKVAEPSVRKAEEPVGAYADF